MHILQLVLPAVAVKYSIVLKTERVGDFEADRRTANHERMHPKILREMCIYLPSRPGKS